MKHLTLEAGLILVYGSILLFSIIFSFVLWFKTNTIHYKILAQGCVLLLITGIIQGLLPQEAYLLQALAASTVFFGTVKFIRLLNLITGSHFYVKKYYVIYFSGVALTFGFHRLGLHPTYMALPALLGMSWLALENGTKAFFKNNSSFIVKCFAAAEVLRALHNLDFSYVYVHTEWLVLGFTLALVLIFATTTFATAAALETLTAENTRYKMEIEYGAMMANADRLAYLGKMANGMAHEINNPLAVIQLTTDQLKRRASKSDLTNDLVIRNMGVIEDSVHRINKIIRGLQNFGRDAGQDPIQTASLSEIIKDTLFFMQEKLQNSDIEFKHKGLSEAYVTCRPTQISQVLISILNNAIDALKLVDKKWIEIEIRDENEFIQVRITDNGSGISAEIHDKIFHPFFTTKDIGEGSGLGLPSSLGIIKSNGGQLIHEKDSQYTTFVIKLLKA